MRIDAAPAVEVHIVSSREAPGGVGELAVPPIAAAVGNGIFAATRQRVRSLPFSAQRLGRA
jgi:isoquinoline 1-oxidoreductase beta subunit